MALVVKDRVQETSTTTGTGTFTLAGAVSGFQSFSVIGNANTTYYTIVGGSEWEVGLGTYTSSGTTLSRDTVLESSNSGSLVNFSAGTKNVFVTYPAEKSVYLDNSDKLNVNANGLTFNDNTTQNTSAYGGGFAMRNRIINGDMRIDQRNAGASITPTASTYTLDRWYFAPSLASKFTIQQNAGSVTPPAGFTNYLGTTVASAVGSLGASDYFQLMQKIEGFNAADLDFGKATAKTITISFWARSSQTGTFSAALVNQNFTRSYVFTYTISSANTWTYITATIAGDTTGTWTNTTNSTLLYLVFNLGYGSTYQTSSPNTWLSGEYYQSSGSVTLVNTAGATFYITGVQLEKGSTATSFDYRPYSAELAMCQRYYEKSYNVDVSPTTNTTTGIYNASGSSDAGSNIIVGVTFAVSKRASPTVTGYTNTGTSGQWGYNRNGASGSATVTIDRIGTYSFRAYTALGAAWAVGNTDGHWVASAEL